LKTLFQEKDYLNGRFFQKKAYFLAVIAAAVTALENGLNVNAEYQSVGDDPRLTTLVLTPKSGSFTTIITQ
jgi:U3 small nucleolar RNA-associated protein 22